MARVALFALAILISSTSAFAQANTQAAPVRDPIAVSLLNVSIASMGGQAAVPSIQDVTMIGQSQSADSSESPAPFIWQSRGLDVRRDQTSSDGHDVFFVHRGKGQRVRTDGGTEPIKGRMALAMFPFECPAIVLLHLLNDSNRSLEMVSDSDSIPGALHLRTKRTYGNGRASAAEQENWYATQQDWYFDAVTGLPLRVEFSLPDVKDPRRDSVASIFYDGWQTNSGVQFPTIMRLAVDGEVQATMTISTIQTNQGLNVVLFQGR